MFPEFGDKFDYHLWLILGTCNTCTWKKAVLFFFVAHLTGKVLSYNLFWWSLYRVRQGGMNCHGWQEWHILKGKTTWRWLKTSWKIRYTPVNEHSNGKWTHWRCISYWTWGYSTAMLVYQGISNPMITSEIWLFEPKNHPIEKKIIFHPPSFLDSMFIHECRKKFAFSHTTHLQISNFKQGRKLPMLRIFPNEVKTVVQCMFRIFFNPTLTNHGGEGDSAGNLIKAEIEEAGKERKFLRAVIYKLLQFLLFLQSLCVWLFNVYTIWDIRFKEVIGIVIVHSF